MNTTPEQANKPRRMVVYTRRYGKGADITVKVDRDTMEVICDIELHRASIGMLKTAVKYDVRDFEVTGERFAFIRFSTIR